MSQTFENSERQRRLERLDHMADRLDARFRVLGIRFGWDSILGLVPGVGDAVTALPGVYMIYEGAQMGARKRVLAKMGANTAIDMVIGGIPIVGDAFDLFFKANRRNIAILKRGMARHDRSETPSDGKETLLRSGENN